MRKIINYIRPSFYISENDPLHDILLDENFKILSLNAIKLIKPVAQKVINARKQVPEFRVSKKGLLSVIVPFRNREEQLGIFVPKISHYLDQQKLKYEIIIVEQCNNHPFNIAILKNIGALNSVGDWFALHDVDFIPLEACYDEPSQPLRSISFITGDKYRINAMEDNCDSGKVIESYFSGVILITKKDYFSVNGYSNQYWGWGSEDVDFLVRMLLSGKIPVCYQKGKFLALNHKSNGPQKDNTRKERFVKEKLMKRNRRKLSDLKREVVDFQKCGVNQTKYSLLEEKIQEIEGYRYRRLKTDFDFPLSDKGPLKDNVTPNF